MDHSQIKVGIRMYDEVTKSCGAGEAVCEILGEDVIARERTEGVGIRRRHVRRRWHDQVRPSRHPGEQFVVGLADRRLDVVPVERGCDREVVKCSRCRFPHDDTLRRRAETQQTGSAATVCQVNRIGLECLGDIAKQAQVIDIGARQVSDIPVRSGMRIAPGTRPVKHGQAQTMSGRDPAKTFDRHLRRHTGNCTAKCRGRPIASWRVPQGVFA